jgi:hypothetical protein
MNSKSALVFLLAFFFSGCTPEYIYPYPYDQVYVHDDSYCGAGTMYGDDVYVDAFGLAKATATNEDVAYIGEVHRVDLFELRNRELRRGNEELFKLVQEDLEKRGEPEHLSQYTQRLMEARNRCNGM